MKRKYIPWALCVLLFADFSGLKAQVYKADTTIVSEIRNFEMNHSQVTDILSYLSDVFGPRLTFLPEYKEAVDWASNKLKEWGLQYVHFETWRLVGKGWPLKSFYAEVTSPRVLPLIVFPNAWSPGFDKPVSSEVAYLEIRP